MMSLRSEIIYFDQIEQSLIEKGLIGHFVVIHEREILAEGRTAAEAVDNLLAKYPGKAPPEPLLVRQILGPKRKPLHMSPRTASQPR